MVRSAAAAPCIMSGCDMVVKTCVSFTPRTSYFEVVRATSRSLEARCSGNIFVRTDGLRVVARSMQHAPCIINPGPERCRPAEAPDGLPTARRGRNRPPSDSRKLGASFRASTLRSRVVPDELGNRRELNRRVDRHHDRRERGRERCGHRFRALRCAGERRGRRALVVASWPARAEMACCILPVYTFFRSGRRRCCAPRVRVLLVYTFGSSRGPLARASVCVLPVYTYRQPYGARHDA